ncbi:MAG: hypothetical protein GTO02_13410, partial [Candidatus Dadabacteria bacterium]|nr:hypothetical protein [Candidatus Dadabacteria bacterium]
GNPGFSRVDTQTTDKFFINGSEIYSGTVFSFNTFFEPVSQNGLGLISQVSYLSSPVCINIPPLRINDIPVRCGSYKFIIAESDPLCGYNINSSAKLSSNYINTVIGTPA